MAFAVAGKRAASVMSVRACSRALSTPALLAEARNVLRSKEEYVKDREDFLKCMKDRVDNLRTEERTQDCFIHNLWFAWLRKHHGGRAKGILRLFMEHITLSVSLELLKPHNFLLSKTSYPYPFAELFEVPCYKELTSRLSEAAGSDDVSTVVGILHHLQGTLEQSHHIVVPPWRNKVTLSKAWLKDDAHLKILTFICEYLHLEVEVGNEEVA